MGFGSVACKNIFRLPRERYEDYKVQNEVVGELHQKDLEENENVAENEEL